MPPDVLADALASAAEWFLGLGAVLGLVWIAWQIGSWAWGLLRRMTSGPPMPQLGPYQGPRILGPGDFVRAGQAQREGKP